APLGWGMNITEGYYGDYGIPVSWWVFCDERHVYDRHVWNYYLPRTHNQYLYSHSTVIGLTHYDANHHIAYASGPRREDVAAVAHVNVRQVAVRPTVTPAQRYDNQHLHIYKPEVKPNEQVSPRPAPQRAVQQNQVPTRSNYQRQYSAPAQQQQQRPQPQQRSEPQRSAPMQQRSAPAQHSAPSGSGRGGHR
ncbi:MAG TPA: hypothetical protein VN922_03150, partial [Bacteroidia bacterium]|nr:hypothetical protein [Bacteroidia bacterium]